MLSLLLLLAAPALGHLPFQLSDGVAPLLSAPLDTSFSCEGRIYGYYADVANNCQVFHVCLPIPEEGGLVRVVHFSFACGNQTVFSQFSLTCSHPEDAFPCDQAESLYDTVNAEFGKRLDGGRSEIVFPEDSAPAATAPVAAAPASDAAPAASATIDVDATLDAAAADDIASYSDYDTVLPVEKSLDSDYPLVGEQSVAEDVEAPAETSGYLPL